MPRKKTKARGKKKTSEKPPGRPRKFTAEDEVEVANMAYFGCTNTEIADFFGVDESTIRARFPEMLKRKRAERNYHMRKIQTVELLKGNSTMLVWLGKNGLGQKEKVDHTTAGQPLVITNAPFDEI